MNRAIPIKFQVLLLKSYILFQIHRSDYILRRLFASTSSSSVQFNHPRRTGTPPNRFNLNIQFTSNDNSHFLSRSLCRYLSLSVFAWKSIKPPSLCCCAAFNNIRMSYLISSTGSSFLTENLIVRVGHWNYAVVNCNLNTPRSRVLGCC